LARIVVSFARAERARDPELTRLSVGVIAWSVSEAPLSSTLAFRFTAIYFTLYALCMLSSKWVGFGWDLLASWVGTHVLGIDSMTFWPTVSGDTTVDYVLLFTFVVLAVLGCIGWTAFDRGRTTHPRLAAWLTVAARYWLGVVMICYGVIKVFPLQFTAPDLVRLGDTYGESSPPGLLMTFMGHSPVYMAFAGGAEVLGGVLLFWRRTTTLGALICIGVMAHVVVLNFSYDVPVKLFASHVLVVALVLASHDAPRLWGVLVLGSAVPARVTPPITTTSRGHRIRWAIKSLLLVGLTVANVAWVRQELAQRGPGPVYGLYDVVSHEIECDPSRSCGDELRWEQVVFGHNGQLALEPLQGPRTKHRVDGDGSTGLVLTPFDGGPIMLFDTHEPDEGTLVLDGRFGGAEHRITLERVDDPKFLLVDWGFHWISEPDSPL
jgi:hypothetical protein